MTEPAGATHLPDVEHLLVVTQESPSPDQALTGYTWISYADVFYLTLDIIDGCNRGDRNLKGVRISGQFDADEQRHEGGNDVNAASVGQTWK